MSAQVRSATAMASTAEQPPKKRKIYDPSPPSPPPPPHTSEPQQPPSSPQTKANAPSKTLSQEEILRRRRNQEEIRNFYECYKKIKNFVAKKDLRLMPELEQAYLALITASRGCTSVQRLVAEIIPKYASYCPTALEAAAKVCINMHNWNRAVISRGDDDDDVAFQTAKACIFGLAVICQAASSEAPTSSVIQGICSAVFLNVLSFFISSFDGQGVFQIVNKDVVKMLGSPKIFYELKQKFSDEEESAVVKLSKFRALSFLWVFFSCPRNSLAACFELYSSTSTDGVSNGGQYFLTQVTSRLDDCDVAYPLDGNSNGIKSSTGAVGSSSEVKDVPIDGPVSIDNTLPDDAYHGPKSCLLSLVLNKDSSMRGWIFSKYRKLSRSASPNIVSDITSALGRIFESFAEQVEAEGKDEDSDEDESNPSKLISGPFLVPKITNQHKTTSESSARDEAHPDDATDQISGLHLERHSSITSAETDIRSNTCSNIDSGGLRSIDIDCADHREFSRASSSTPRDLVNNQMPSPTPRNPLELRSNSFDGRNHASMLDHNIPALSTPGGGANSTFESPKHHLPSPYPPAGQPSWYFDGDLFAMDIFPASRQLWLGSLGPDASEALVRFHFEKFGPINKFLYIPFKRSAIIEYIHIMDAVKAREVMRGRAPWGDCLLVKFLDIGFGTRGDMNGVAVGSSCHVYVGNVPSQADKDEILHELRKVLYKGPHTVNDLVSEGALLMEFGTPEEASMVMAHLRQHRKEKHDHVGSSIVGPTNFVMPVVRARHGSGSLHFDLRNNNLGNGIVSSPHGQTLTGFSHSGTPHTNPMELTSPRINAVNQGATSQSGHAFQSDWLNFGAGGKLDAGARSYDTSIVVDPSQAGSQIVPGAPEQHWMYRKPESVPQSAPGSIPSMSTPTQGHNVAPPQPIQASPFMQPVYYPPNSSWDPRGLNQHLPLNPISSGVMPNNLHSNTVAPPFLPASVTPLAQIQGNTMPQPEQMFLVPPPLINVPAHRTDSVPPLPQPNLRPPFPLHPELAPPLPPSPPPLLESQPPPPPPLSVESSTSGNTGQCPPYKWQGTLSKSGVHYSTIYANRLHSDICTYANAISEPAEWPSKLDMTKRTDFRHVMSTFSSTPLHKREVCQLLPASTGDHKGFQDFVSYLKQRECAGVIKIPASNTMWARLLFILPYSHDICSLLSVAPYPLDCLIALILPKETSFEWI